MIDLFINIMELPLKIIAENTIADSFAKIVNKIIKKTAIPAPDFFRKLEKTQPYESQIDLNENAGNDFRLNLENYILSGIEKEKRKAIDSINSKDGIWLLEK